MEDRNTKRSSALINIVLIPGCILVAVCYMAAIMFVLNSVFMQEGLFWDKQYLKENNSTNLELAAEDANKEAVFEIQESEPYIQEDEIKINEKNNKSSNRINIKTASTIQGADVAQTVVSDVTEVVKAAMPSVVAITNQYPKYDFWAEQVINERTNGSGIIISQNEEELLIVTNYHVIESASDLYVKFINEKEVIAYVKGADSKSDLAVISVSMSELDDDTLSSITIAAFGDSEELQVGEPAIAIGNSLGYGQSVTTGVISALDRKLYLQEDGEEGINDEYLIQTDAAINPGNSGGALLNVHGEVIGINSSKIADSLIEGIGYAIPITTAKPIIDELSLKETKKKVSEDERGFLGISGKDVSDEAMESYGIPQGVYVVSIIEDTAAYNYGLLKGDIIVEIDGEKISQMTRIQNMMEFYSAGETIGIAVMRLDNGEYKEYKFNVVLGKNN